MPLKRPQSADLCRWQFFPGILSEFFNFSEHETDVVNLDHHQIPESREVLWRRPKLLRTILRLRRNNSSQLETTGKWTAENNKHRQNSQGEMNYVHN